MYIETYSVFIANTILSTMVSRSNILYDFIHQAKSAADTTAHKYTETDFLAVGKLHFPARGLTKTEK